MNHNASEIAEPLVRRLLTEQFPELTHVPIRPVARSGWDNRMFRLGEEMVVRLPSGPAYAGAVEREQRWLPYLAPQLPLSIPELIAVGQPVAHFPWPWSIYRWIDGDALQDSDGVEHVKLGTEVGQFLSALQTIDTSNGPRPGPENFYRGGWLSVYEEQTIQAISLLGDQVDSDSVRAIWQRAMASRWTGKPVWVHGDVSAGNLLVNDGKLCGVIDFGQLCVGDPACDLAIAWAFFADDSRAAFQEALSLDSETWHRGRGWALWKALIVAAELVQCSAIESGRCWHTMREVLAEYANTT